MQKVCIGIELISHPSYNSSPFLADSHEDMDLSRAEKPAVKTINMQHAANVMIIRGKPTK